MIKIGNTKIDHGLFLAPMAGMTDGPFRKIAREAGCEYAITEMVSSIAITYGDYKTIALMESEDIDTPLAIQIFGHDPDIMAKATEIILNGSLYTNYKVKKPAAIDINMGCPVKKIAGNGDGSALMANPTLVGKIVKSVVNVANKYDTPVTCKIRAGLTKDTINAVEVAKEIADNGASAIYVHGRTREQLYAPPVNLDIIKRVRDAVSPEIPVIGNGDIKNFDDALNMISYTSCDGIMIGRAALGNPWIFSEIKAKMDNLTYNPPDDVCKMQAAISMIEDMAKIKGELNAVREARGRAAYFIRDKKGASKIREKLNHAETIEEFKNILLG